MSKFCSTCGAQLEDDNNFCASCGTKSEPIETPQPAAEPIDEPAAEQPEATEENAVHAANQAAEPADEPANASPFVAYTPNDTTAPEPAPSDAAHSENTVCPEPTKKSGKGVLIAILIVILVLLIGAGILIYFLFFSSSACKEAVEAYYEVQEDLEFEDFKKATGYAALTAIIEDKNSSDIQTFKLGCQRMQQIYKKTNIDLDVEYEILDMQKISKDDLEKYNIDSLIAKEGYEVDVSYTVKLESTGDKESRSETLSVVKFDGEWCVTDIVDDIDNIIPIGELSDDDFTAALEYYE